MEETNLVVDLVREGGGLVVIVFVLLYLDRKDMRLSKTLDSVAKTNSEALQALSAAMSEHTSAINRLVGIVSARLSTLAEDP